MVLSLVLSNIPKGLCRLLGETEECCIVGRQCCVTSPAEMGSGRHLNHTKTLNGDIDHDIDATSQDNVSHKLILINLQHFPMAIWCISIQLY